MLELRDGDYDEWQMSQLFTQTCTNQTTSWLMHSYITFGAQTSHNHTWIHETRHDMDLGETITFLFIVFFMTNHGSYTQMSFCLGTPKLGVLKFPKLGLLAFWNPINLLCKPPSESRQFSIFNGQKSKWHFDLRTFFQP